MANVEQKESQYRLRGIAKEYALEGISVSALHGVDLDIYRGELIVLLGPSGSGKSTLLNLLGALDRPTKGRIECGSLDLSQCNDRDLTRFRRQHLGFVFQSYNLAASLTAIENVQMATDLIANPLSSEQALIEVGMRERMHHFPAQLSGGEQQRVAIARALAKRPQVLLCDEPTGALDIETGKLVLETIETVHQNFKPTIVIITHNAAIARMADRVCYLSNGTIHHIEVNQNRAPARELVW